MSRFFSTLIAISLTTGVFAQEKDSLWNHFPVFYNHPFSTKKPSAFLEVKGSSLIDASAANNSLLYAVYFKKPLNNEVILTNADRMKQRNSGGSESSFEIGYYNLDKGFCKKDSLHWFTRYGFRDVSSVYYTGDLFRLAGTGNKYFEGDTAYGGPLDFNRTTFDYLEFGVVNYFANRSVLTVSAGPARGMRMIDVEAGLLDVYTAEYGTSMNWNVNLNARFTDGTKTGYGAVNGMGATISADYSGLLNESGAYNIGFKNFGAINWEGTEWRKKDSFSYEGIYLLNFRDLTDSSFQNSADSVERIFMPEKSSFKSWEMLPANFYAQYTMKIGHNKSLSFRFDKNFFSPMLVRFSSALTYFKGDFFGITQVSFGGFGRFSLNQDIGLSLGKHFVHARFYGIDGLFTPKLSSGSGLGVSYMYRF